MRTPSALNEVTAGVVKRAIVGYHQDDEGDWVADLACGHTRHVRHNPPWTSRPWVTTREGREGMLGRHVTCATCSEEAGEDPSIGEGRWEI